MKMIKKEKALIIYLKNIILKIKQHKMKLKMKI